MAVHHQPFCEKGKRETEGMDVAALAEGWAGQEKCEEGGGNDGGRGERIGEICHRGEQGALAEWSNLAVDRTGSPCHLCLGDREIRL